MRSHTNARVNCSGVLPISPVVQSGRIDRDSHCRPVHAAAKAQRLREAGSAEGCKAAVRNGASSAASGARRPPARSRPVSFAGPAGGMMRARLAALLPLPTIVAAAGQVPPKVWHHAGREGAALSALCARCLCR